MFDQLQKDAKAAGKDIGDGLQKGFKEGEQASGKAKKQIGEDLDKTAKKAKESGTEAGTGFGSGMADATSAALSGGNPLEGLMDQVSSAAPVVGAAAVGIGAALMAGINSAIERQTVGATLAGQLGGGADEARHFGQLAGKVYAEGYGDSLEAAAEGIRAVVQNRLVKATDPAEAISRMSELAMTAATVTGETADAVARAAHQMLVTGLSKSAEEAFDTIVAGTQKGLNASEDLLDTLTEYSTKFRDLGLNGQQALGLISQALDAGARDTDTAADALKEFAIRAQDGSASTARGFATIGLNADQMGASIAHGGRFAKAALEQTLDGLRNIHDPLLRDQAAVDLFGTKAEDLGDALYSMDLKTAAKQFGDLAHATDAASTVMETNAQKTSKAWKEFGQGFSNVVDTVGGKLYDTGGALAMLLGTAEKVSGTPVAPKGLEGLENLNGRLGSVTKGWLAEADAISNVTMTLEKNIAKHREAAGAFISAQEGQIKYQKAIDDASQSLKDNGKTLDIHAEKGRNNEQALLDLASAAYTNVDAMEKNGAAAIDVQAAMIDARQQFIAVATQMGMTRDQAAQMANQLRLIPGDYEAKVGMDASGFYAVGAGVQATLRQFSKGVTIPIGGKAGSSLGFATGGAVGHAAEGGPRGNRVVVGEHGPEFVDLAPGSTVHSNPDSQRMMAMAGGGGRVDVNVNFGGNLDGVFASAFMKLCSDGAIRIEAITR